MPRNQSNRSNRGGNRSSERSAFSWGTAREKPLATAVTIGAAAAAGAFLWSRRNQITEQLSDLSEQIGEWSENLSFSGSDESEFESVGGGSAGAMSTGTSGRLGGTRSGGSRGTTGISETGGGNASLGAHSGGGGTTTSPSGRGRARSGRNS